MQPQGTMMVISGNIFQTEIKIEIFFNGLIRAMDKLFLVKYSKTSIKTVIQLAFVCKYMACITKIGQ